MCLWPQSITTRHITKFFNLRKTVNKIYNMSHAMVIPNQRTKKKITTNSTSSITTDTVKHKTSYHFQFHHAIKRLIRRNPIDTQTTAATHRLLQVPRHPFPYQIKAELHPPQKITTTTLATHPQYQEENFQQPTQSNQLKLFKNTHNV